jgi:hypothetical protein
MIAGIAFIVSIATFVGVPTVILVKLYPVE